MISVQGQINRLITEHTDPRQISWKTRYITEVAFKTEGKEQIIQK